MDTEKADQSLSRTEQRAEGVGARFRGMIGTAAKWGAVLGGAALAVGGAVVALGNKTAASADRIDKMSQKLGLSRRGFQEWDFILSQSGASIDAFQAGLRTLHRAADEAAQGVETYTEVFDRLGLSVVDVNGDLKDQETLFNETILALSQMENHTERAALASQILGRSASELAPLLNSGADSVEELRQKAHELGLVLDDELIDTGVQWTDTMDQIKRALGSIWMEIANRVMPTFLGWLQWLAVNIPKAGYILEFLGNVAKIVFGAMAELAGQAWDAVKPLIVDSWDWTINTAGTAWEWITETTWQEKLQDIRGWLKDAWQWIIDTAGTAWRWLTGDDALGPVIDAVGKALERAWEWTVNAAGSAWDWIKNTTWQQKLEDIKSWLSAAWTWTVNLAGAAWDWITENLPWVDRAVSRMGNWISQGWNWVINIAGNAWDWFVANPVQAVIDLWNNARTAVVDAVRGIYEGAKEWLLDKMEPIVAPIKDIVNGIAGAWEWLSDHLVGHSVIPDMVDAIAAEWATLKEKLAAPTDDVISGVEYKFDQFAEDQEDQAERIVETWQSAFQNIGNLISRWITDTTVNLFAGVAMWQDLFTSFGSLATQVLRDLFATMVTQMVQNAIAQQSWLAATLANIATAIAAYISQAYAALVAFYWWLGPGAPVAAAATIAVVTAAVAKYAGQALRGIFGGGGGTPDMPEEPGAPGGGSGGGRQVSEITGPTRDLLTSLLSPLARLDEQTGILQRIYDLLDVRMPEMGGMVPAMAGGPSITFEPGSIQIYPQSGDAAEISDDLVAELEERLSDSWLFNERGQG